MTNREKYIDNASNEEIASALCGMGLQYRYSPDTQLRVEEWLSQEVEEEESLISREYVEDMIKKHEEESGESIKLMTINEYIKLISLEKRVVKTEAKVAKLESRIEKLEMANWLKEV